MSNNFLTKLWYKIFNKEKYIDLKNEKRTSDRVKYYNSRIYAQIFHCMKKLSSLSSIPHQFFRKKFFCFAVIFFGNKTVDKITIF